MSPKRVEPRSANGYIPYEMPKAERKFVSDWIGFGSGTLEIAEGAEMGAGASYRFWSRIPCVSARSERLLSFYSIDLAKQYWNEHRRRS